MGIAPKTQHTRGHRGKLLMAQAEALPPRVLHARAAGHAIILDCCLKSTARLNPRKDEQL